MTMTPDVVMELPQATWVYVIAHHNAHLDWGSAPYPQGWWCPTIPDQRERTWAGGVATLTMDGVNGWYTVGWSDASGVHVRVILPLDYDQSGVVDSQDFFEVATAFLDGQFEGGSATWFDWVSRFFG